MITEQQIQDIFPEASNFNRGETHGKPWVSFDIGCDEVQSDAIAALTKIIGVQRMDIGTRGVRVDGVTNTGLEAIVYLHKVPRSEP